VKCCRNHCHRRACKGDYACPAHCGRPRARNRRKGRDARGEETVSVATQKPILICDIDGVIADLSHRLHHIEEKPTNWDGFFDACDEDKPMEETISFLRAIRDIFEIVYLTGRPKRVRDKTVAWFRQNYVPWKDGMLLAMRSDGDHRQDWIVKWELFDQWVDKKRVRAIIEDRDQVVQMWREKGYFCLQNKRGDY
jgi:hypothetical protein